MDESDGEVEVIFSYVPNQGLHPPDERALQAKALAVLNGTICDEETPSKKVKEEEMEDVEMPEDVGEEREKESPATEEKEGEMMEGLEKTVKEIPASYLKHRRITYEENDSEHKRKSEKEKRRSERDQRKEEKERKRARSLRFGKIEKKDDKRSKRSSSRRTSHSDKEKRGHHHHHHHHHHHKRSDEKWENRSSRKKWRRVETTDEETSSDESSIVVDTRDVSHISTAFRRNAIRRLALLHARDNDPEANFTIQGLMKGHCALGLERVNEDVTEKSIVGETLGAAYDRVLRSWLYTDTQRGQVVLASYDGRELDRMDGFNKPCAIAVIIHGSHFAVLDKHGITIVHAATNTKKRIENDFGGYFRGLATTSDGNLVSMMFKPLENIEPQLVVFSVHDGSVICSLWYPNAAGGLPSFLCSNRDMIYVTDLNRNCLSSFSYNKHKKVLEDVTNRNLSRYYMYMSGVAVDSASNLLVADAERRSIYLVSPDGRTVQRIPFLDNAGVYISGIALSPTGRVMVCCRRQAAVRLYQLVPLDRMGRKVLETTGDLMARVLKGCRLAGPGRFPC